MKSDIPKGMHKIGGLPIVNHVIHACGDIDPDNIVVVIGPDMDALAANVAPARTVVQTLQSGTGDAARCAGGLLDNFDGSIFVLLGDVPLIQAETLESLRQASMETGLAVLGFHADNPHGYGRLMTDKDGFVTKIVEEKDAAPAEKETSLCNSGAFCADGKYLFDWLSRIENTNAQGEYYLTDIVAIAATQGVKCACVTASETEVMGINSREQLAAAETILQNRLRKNAMDAGVTMVDPATVYLSVDTVFGRDVIIEPNVVIGMGVRVGNNVRLNAFSHIEGAVIGDQAEIGPFARIRPHSVIGDKASIGNFVEVNRAEMKTGSKSKHMSYLGDVVIGENTNIGAGSVFANYDGFLKHKTVVGQNVFVGSNSTLVAPLVIGNGAFVAAGSTVTVDVADDSLVIARNKANIREGWAAGYRVKKQQEKKAVQ